MRRLRRTQAGFTLIEVLAAFVMLVLLLGGLFSATAGAMRSSSNAAFEQKALRLAQSHLDALGVASPLALGMTIGQFDGELSWHQRVTPYSPARPANGIGGYWVDLTVEQSRLLPGLGRRLNLTTLKLASPARP